MKFLDRLRDRPKAILRKSMMDRAVSEEHNFASQRQRLAYSEIETAYLRDPLVFRAVNKKSRDVFKKWHAFTTPEGGEVQPDDPQAAKLREWARKVGLKRRLMNALSDAYLYGDGYLEVVYAGDEGTGPADRPVTVGGIKALVPVNPATMRPVRDTRAGSPTLGEVLYYEQKVPGKPKAIKLHPARIRHVQLYRLGDDARGVGSVETAYNVIRSKVKGDISLGEILHWDAKGFQVMLIEGASEEEITKGYEALESARERGINFFVGSERHKFDVVTPSPINPEPIVNVFYTNLAAALDMPKDLLLGLSAGAVTGSEVNLRDYYEDCHAILEAHFTHLAEGLYASHLGVQPADLSVRVWWNPLFVNEQAEADTRFKLAQAASIAYRDGVITGNEYRAVLELEPLDGLEELYIPPAAPAFDDPDDDQEPDTGGDPEGDGAGEE